MFVDDLTVMDFSYLDDERGILGESWRVHIELAGTLDAQGMVLDFGDVKPLVKRVLDADYDHRLLVPAAHPDLRIDTPGTDIELTLPLRSGGQIHHRGPAEAVAMIPSARIDTDAVAADATRRLRTDLPANITDIVLTLKPEAGPGPCYQYSHGLRGHGGNCQRIAHGHRSRIEIWRDGRRDAALESAWAARWRDSYIGSRRDLVRRVDIDGEPHCEFRYRASQGEFELLLPARRCHLIETDSTVENLAQFIADRLAQDHPGARIRVRAYEGVNKGAIAESLT